MSNAGKCSSIKVYAISSRTSHPSITVAISVDECPARIHTVIEIIDKRESSNRSAAVYHVNSYRHAVVACIVGYTVWVRNSNINCMCSKRQAADSSRVCEVVGTQVVDIYTANCVFNWCSTVNRIRNLVRR